VSAPAISIEDLCVRAGARTILSIARLSIASGECVGILGPNGAGKTTLLRSCLGLQRHAHGTVRVLGDSIGQSGFIRRARLRRRIGYVPQLLSAGAEMPLTVREVVAIGRSGIAGLWRPLSVRDWHLIDGWLDRLGLSSLANRGYGEISGGEQRKTLIARAMVQEPQLLLLDEPTANLDVGWRERIVDIIDRLHQDGGLSILLVCHELEVLPHCCRRVVILHEGQVTADATPEHALSDASIAVLYGPGLGVLHQAGRHALVPAVLTHV
jgi:ABC-type Mn2+/Zn2+ transport system ATPase subunit